MATAFQENAFQTNELAFQIDFAAGIEIWRTDVRSRSQFLAIRSRSQSVTANSYIQKMLISSRTLNEDVSSLSQVEGVSNR
jgi:uncharacterized protein YwgA